MNPRFLILRSPSPQQRQSVTGEDCVLRHNGQLFLQHWRSVHPTGFFLLAFAALLLITPALHAQNSHRANLVRAQSQFFFAPDSPSLVITGDPQWRDEFSGSTLDASKWVVDSGGQVIVANGSASLTSGSEWTRGFSTAGKKLLQRQAYTIEFRARRNSDYDVALDLTDGTNGIVIYESNYYSNRGLTLNTAGAFGGSSQSNDAPTTAWKEYRVIVNGSQVTVQRGDTLANITETLSKTLSTSVADYPLFLRFRNGGTNTVEIDWIRIYEMAGTVQISGTVTGLTGLGIVRVRAISGANTYSVDAAPDGQYSISGLPGGQRYTVFAFQDTNGNQVPDSTEFVGYHQTLLLLVDTDKSGIGMVLIPYDSDSDGMIDSWEIANGLTVGVNDAGLDKDGDGLNNAQEFWLGLNANNTDSDGDGLSDFAEVNMWGTNSLSADTDGDGLPDKWETDNGLNPRRDDASEDRDGDGLTNAQEYSGGTNPGLSDNVAEKAVTHFYDSLDRLVATTYSNGGWMAWRYDGNGNILKQKFGAVRDADGDGLPDAWEFAYGIDITPGTGASGPGGFAGDSDGDGWANVQEFLAGTSPVNAASAPSVAASMGAAWFTTPTAHIILPPANGGGIAIVTATVWDSEGNPAQFALQWFDATANVWKNATLVRVDSSPFAPGSTLATSPAGILHTFRWNTVADFPGGKNGSLLIRLSVTDAAGTTISPSMPYSVNNTGDTDGDGLPDWWEVPRGLDPNDASGVSGAYGNPDGDGFVNFAEFAFGLNPLSFDSIGAPTVTAEVNPADGKTYLTLTYPRRTDAPSLVYEIQTTTDLATWTTTGADIEPISTAPGGSNLEVVKVRIHPPLGSPGMPEKFVRLRMRLP